MLVYRHSTRGIKVQKSLDNYLSSFTGKTVVWSMGDRNVLGMSRNLAAQMRDINQSFVFVAFDIETYHEMKNHCDCCIFSPPEVNFFFMYKKYLIGGEILSRGFNFLYLDIDCIVRTNEFLDHITRILQNNDICCQSVLHFNWLGEPKPPSVVNAGTGILAMRPSEICKSICKKTFLVENDHKNTGDCQAFMNKVVKHLPDVKLHYLSTKLYPNGHYDDDGVIDNTFYILHVTGIYAKEDWNPDNPSNGYEKINTMKKMGYWLNKTVLVTGGGGFLGSWICKRLVSRGCSVICLDNWLTGNPANLADIIDDPLLTVITGDIKNPDDLKRCGHVDEIFNLACPASPIWYRLASIDTLETNVLGIYNILQYMLSHPQDARPKLLQCSTSEIYGDPLEHPQKESYWGNTNILGVRSCYDEGKRVAETFCYEYSAKMNLDIRVARIFNTYGPNMSIDDGRAVSNFIVQALRGDDITVYGDGTQTRSFCYVTDTINGLLRIMNGKRLKYVEPINIGNPVEITLLELATHIKNITQAKGSIVFDKLPSDDPVKRCPDIERAKLWLDWEPQVDLSTGLVNTIEYFKDRLS